MWTQVTERPSQEKQGNYCSSKKSLVSLEGFFKKNKKTIRLWHGNSLKTSLVSRSLQVESINLLLLLSAEFEPTFLGCQSNVLTNMTPAYYLHHCRFERRGSECLDFYCSNYILLTWLRLSGCCWCCWPVTAALACERVTGPEGIRLASKQARGSAARALSLQVRVEGSVHEVNKWGKIHTKNDSNSRGFIEHNTSCSVQVYTWGPCCTRELRYENSCEPQVRKLRR